MQQATPDQRIYYGILREFHLWGYLTLSNLRDLLLTYPNTLLPYLRKLMKEKYILDAGYPPVKGGENPLFGRYYCVSRKSPPPAPPFLNYQIMPRDFRVKKLAEHEEMPGGCFLMKDEQIVKRHQLWVSYFAAWMQRIMIEEFEPEALLGRQKTELVPEFFLKKRGWYGRGNMPTSGDPFLTMVPDFLINFGTMQCHIQVELTLKSRSRYERDFEILEPRNQHIIYITPEPEMIPKLKRLHPTGYSIFYMSLGDRSRFREIMVRMIADSFTDF